MRYTRKEFEKFLSEVELSEYRKKYSHIKTVEMDLDKPVDIEALDDIYALYWDEEVTKRKIPSYEDFYKIYYKNNEDNIKIFWNSSGFGKECDCFTKGLEARIYRTWASLITQIHAGYVAEEVFGKGTVKQSTELDHKKIDFCVQYKGKELKFQVKKVTSRKEIARMTESKEKTKDLIYLKYLVVDDKKYEAPRYSVGKNKGKLKSWAKQFKEFSKLGFVTRLNNGFVVFTEKKFEAIKAKIDAE